jgi:hypothetical protein
MSRVATPLAHCRSAEYPSAIRTRAHRPYRATELGVEHDNGGRIRLEAIPARLQQSPSSTLISVGNYERARAALRPAPALGQLDSGSHGGMP